MNKAKKAEIKANINRGIEFLNEIRPNWYKEISIENFEMRSFKQCVLGQLYGCFLIAKKKLNIDVAAPYGFSFPVDPDRYKKERSYWNKLWKAKILKLQKTA